MRSEALPIAIACVLAAPVAAALPLEPEPGEWSASSEWVRVPTAPRAGPRDPVTFTVEPLELVRIRVREEAGPSFSRAVGDGARVTLPVERLGEDTYLVVGDVAQPVTWQVETREAAPVAVHVARARGPVLAWDVLRNRTFAWIDGHADLPESDVDGFELLRDELRFHESVGHELVRADPSSTAKVRAWRKAAADRLFLTHRPFTASGTRREALPVHVEREGATWKVRADVRGEALVEAMIEVRTTATGEALTTTWRLDDAVKDERTVKLGPDAPRLRRRLFVPGEHGRLELVVSAGAEAEVIGVELTRLTRRRFSDELRAGEPDRAGLLGRATEGTTPALLSALVDVERGRTPLRTALLAALGDSKSAVPASTTTPDALADRARTLPTDTLAGVGWRLAAAEVLVTEQRTTEARTLLDGLKPEGAGFALRAAAIAEAASDPERAWTFAREAYRRAPTASSTRAALRHAWFATTRWTPLDTAGQRFDVVDWSGGPLTGTPLRRVSGPTTLELTDVRPGRSAALRIFALTPPDRPGPIESTLDGESFRWVAFSPLGTMPIAVPAGRHVLRVDAPRGTETFVTTRNSDAVDAFLEEVASLPTEPLVLPGADDRLLRVRLRSGSPVRDGWVELRSGERRLARIHVDTLGASSTARRDARSPAVSDVLEFVARIPARVGTVTFAGSPGTEWLVSLALRSAAGLRATPAAPLDDADAALDRLRQLSERLFANAADTEARVERATLLLALGEHGLARTDRDRLVCADDPAAHDAAAALDAHARALLDDDLPLDGRAVALGTVLTADDELASAVQAARRLRQGTHDDSIAVTSARVRALQAAVAGDWSAALSAWVRVVEAGGDPSAQLALADAWLRSGGVDDLAPVVSQALAVVPSGAVDGWDRLPRLRAARVDSARRSRWTTIEQVLDSAGRVPLPEREDDATLEDRVREALLAWPPSVEGASTIRGGHAGVLDVTVTAEDTLALELFCTSDPRREELTPTCPLRLRVDGHATEELDVPSRTPFVHAVPLAPGRHQVELFLLRDTQQTRLVARHRDGTERLVTRRPREGFATEPDRPVALLVAGPGALRIETASDATPVVTACDVSGTECVQPAVHALGSREAVVLVTSSGPRRVTVAASAPDAVRLAWRVGRAWTEETPAAAIPAVAPLAAAPTPTLPAYPDHVPPAPGTWSATVLGTNEELGEDDTSRPLRTGVEAGVAYRTRIPTTPVWFALQPATRLPTVGAPVFGGRAMAWIRQLPFELRTQLWAESFAQTQGGGWGIGTRGGGLVERVFPLGGDFALRPTAGLAFDVLSAGAGVVPDELDRTVYRSYGVQHTPRGFASTALRWTPLQDQLAVFSLGTSSNARLESIDRVDAAIGWRGLFEVPALRLLRVAAAYELSHRFADANRATPYDRHGFDLRVDCPIGPSRDGRLLLSLRNTLYLGDTTDLRNVTSVGLRFDWSGGRGMRDIAPSVEEFDDFVGRRFWDEGL